MYTFKINALEIENQSALATLILTDNPYVNGKLVGRNDYKTQQTLMLGNTYKLCLMAIKKTLIAGCIYIVCGSWNSGTLYVTAVQEITVDIAYELELLTA